MTEVVAIVQRVCNYCNVLRDDGVSSSDYREKLAYLLFLKMTEEPMNHSGKESEKWPINYIFTGP